MIKNFLLWIQSSKKNIFLVIVLPSLLSILIYYPIKLYDEKLQDSARTFMDLSQGLKVPEGTIYATLKGKIQYGPQGYYLVDEKDKGRLFSYYIPITASTWKEGEALQFFIFRKIRQEKAHYTTKDPSPFLGDGDLFEGRLIQKNLPKELKDYIRSQGNKIAETTYILDSTSWSTRFTAIPACTILLCFFLLMYSYTEKEKQKDIDKRNSSPTSTQETLEFKASNTYLLIALTIFILFSVPAIVLSAPFIAPVFRVSFLDKLYHHIKDPGSFLILMGVFFSLGVGALILYYVRFDTLKIILHPNRGIEVFKRGGTRLVAWNEIDSITSVAFQVNTRGMYAYTSEKHLVTLKDQSKIAFTSGIEDVYRIAQAIDAELLKRLYPDYAEKLKNGLPISFGPLTVTAAGLSKGQETLPWEDVDLVGVDNGSLIVKARGKMFSWYKKTCRKIPNVPILLKLVETKIS